MLTRFAVAFSVFVSTLGVMVIMPILAPLIRELGLSESQGGWMVSIGSVAMAICGALWGMASDRWGRKAVILVGFAGLFAAYSVYTSIAAAGLEGLMTGAPLFAALVAGRAMVGTFLSAAPSAAQAFMADITTRESRSAGMALIGAASGLGMIAGPALGGFLALYGLIWPLVMATALSLMALVLSWLFLPGAMARRVRPVLKLSPFAPEVRVWLLMVLMLMLAIITLQISGGFYFQDRLGLDSIETARFTALALTTVGICLVVTQSLQMAILKWAPRRLVRVGAPVLVVAMTTLLLTASGPAYLIAYGLFGIGAGLVMPGYMAGVSLNLDEDQQGAGAGLIAMMQGVAAIIAPLGSTLLYEWDPVVTLTAAAALCVGVFLAGLAVRRPGEGQAMS